MPTTGDDAFWRDLLTNVGYGLLGSGAGAGLLLWIVGDSITEQSSEIRASRQDLRSQIDQISTVVSSEVARLDQKISAVSNLVAQARALGIVAIGKDRESRVFEDQQTLVDRWEYLLRHADEVDLLCYEDSRLLNFQRVSRFKEQVLGRLRSANLRLRILISSEDNPSITSMSTWIDNREHVTSQITEAVTSLRPITQVFPEILRRHRDMLAFTMLRGDSYLYIMFFLPGQDAGPIVEFQQRIALDAASAAAESDPDQFSCYKALFDELWNRYG